MGEDNNNKMDSLISRVCELEAALEKAHQAEIQALYNESLYRLVTENVTDVIWKVISPSVTNLMGYTVEEALSKTILEIFTRESYDNAISVLADELACIKKGLIARHRSMTLQMNLKHKNGSLVAAEVNYVFIFGNDGNPAEILAVGRDVSERRRAEVLLRQSELKSAILRRGILPIWRR
jgi:PAS domain S-box-containing protein